MRPKRPFMILLVFLLLFPILCRPVSALSEKEIIRQILTYYGHHQDAAETDLQQRFAQLEQMDPHIAQDWQQILEDWHWVVDEFEVTWDILPDGLPQDDSLCIIVMGFRLNYGGAMDEELTRRLEVALASAEKYPNAYIVCTGGGTSSSNPYVTEAGQMAAWLKEQGIAPERIIVENRSYSTEDNVLNTYRILSRDYPQVTSLALVSSDYHLRRCYLLFHAGILLQDMPYTIVADACFDAGYEGTHEGYLEEMKSLGKMAGLDLEYTKSPELSQLTQISIQGRTEYMAGDALSLTVTAEYNSGFTRDVTDLSQITGFDAAVGGEQELLIQYTENGITRECSFSLYVELPPTTEPAATEPTVTPTTLPPVTIPASQPAAQIVHTDSPSLPHLFLIIAALTVLVPVLLFVRSGFRHGKYEKRRRK